eukprot:262911-Alexandrium_andersonii.AAC.1
MQPRVVVSSVRRVRRLAGLLTVSRSCVHTLRPGKIVSGCSRAGRQERAVRGCRRLQSVCSLRDTGSPSSWRVLGRASLPH